MSANEIDDDLLAAALGAGLTYGRAAEVAGVSRATAGAPHGRPELPLTRAHRAGFLTASAGVTGFGDR